MNAQLLLTHLRRIGIQGKVIEGVAGESPLQHHHQ